MRIKKSHKNETLLYDRAVFFCPLLLLKSPVKSMQRGGQNEASEWVTIKIIARLSLFHPELAVLRSFTLLLQVILNYYDDVEHA